MSRLGSETSPYENASCIDHITFGYINSLLVKGSEAPLQLEELDAVPVRDSPQVLTNEVMRQWQKECLENPEAPSLWLALLRSFTYEFYMSGMYALGESACAIAQPVILKHLIVWLASTDGDFVEGICLAIGIAFFGFLQSIIHHQLYYYTMRGGWNVRTACTGMIHEKAMKLCNSALLETSQGQVRRLPPFSLSLPSSSSS